MTDDLFNPRAHGLQRDAERLQRLRGDALALVDETEQDVLGTDVVVVQQARFLLRQNHDSPGPVGEAFEHPLPPLMSVSVPAPLRLPVPPVCASGGDSQRETSRTL